MGIWVINNFLEWIHLIGGLSAEEVKTNVLENVTNNSIILQHRRRPGEDLSGTVSIVGNNRCLKKEGYKFVTVDDYYLINNFLLEPLAKSLCFAMKNSFR